MRHLHHGATPHGPGRWAWSDVAGCVTVGGPQHQDGSGRASADLGNVVLIGLCGAATDYMGRVGADVATNLLEVDRLDRPGVDVELFEPAAEAQEPHPATIETGVLERHGAARDEVVAVCSAQPVVVPRSRASMALRVIVTGLVAGGVALRTGAGGVITSMMNLQ